jgi:hypothetical protein
MSEHDRSGRTGRATSNRWVRPTLYEPDNGALSDTQFQRIRELAQLPELGQTCFLFED